MHHYSITIQFEHQTYRCTAWASATESAYALAVIDARLRQYFGKVVSWDAEDITPDEIPEDIKARFNAGQN